MKTTISRRRVAALRSRCMQQSEQEKSLRDHYDKKKNRHFMLVHHGRMMALEELALEIELMLASPAARRRKLDAIVEARRNPPMCPSV